MVLTLKTGGYLRKYCSHAYAHATTEGATALPAVLKGSDVIAFEVFRSLGVIVLVRPMLERMSEYEYDYEFLEAPKLRTHEDFGDELATTSSTCVHHDDDSSLAEVYAE
jgi:hypothetical protein